MMGTGGTTMAMGSTAMGGMTMAMGGTMVASGGTMMRHDSGDSAKRCKTYCSCTQGKLICKYCHGGHIVAELKCL